MSAKNSGDVDKDVLDHLCATDPHWIAALQVLQLALRQSEGDPIRASAQIICALVILAADTPDPKDFLDYCTDTLRKTPIGEEKP